MSWLQNGNEVLLTSPVSVTEITGLRNTRYNFIFNFIIANPGATVTINATTNDRALSKAHSYKTTSNHGTSLNGMDQKDATLSVGTTRPSYSSNR